MDLVINATDEMGWFVVSYLYCFFGWTLAMVANKTGTSGAGLAWIPVANFWLLIQIAGRSGVWLLVIFIPGLNLIALAALWHDVAGARGKNAAVAWLVLLAPMAVFFIYVHLGLAPIAATVSVLVATLALVQGYVAFGA